MLYQKHIPFMSEGMLFKTKLTTSIIETRENYVIKEIDTTSMTTEQSFEALDEISVQATIDSPYVVSS
jgi:hypothetical protein